MDLDADLTEKAGFGLSYYCAAVVTTITAVVWETVPGYGLSCYCAAVATTTIN